MCRGRTLHFIEFIFIAYCLMAGVLALADTHYVSPTGSHSYPYGSWTKAATNIQAGVDAAAAFDTVMVGDGTYTVGGTYVTGTLTNLLAITRAITVKSLNGPMVTIIRSSLSGTPGTKSSRGVYISSGASLYGFTITNGATHTTGDSYLEQSGGGIFCNGNAYLSNCLITDCGADWYGGGVYATGGVLVLENCTLKGNVAYRGGAAAGTIELIACLLDSNTADGAGAIGGGAYAVNLISNCTLEANSAESWGGGVYGSPVKESTVRYNVAGERGGGLYNCTVDGTGIQGNEAADGGGAYLCTISDSSLSSNMATISGGGASFCGISSSLTYDNHATNSGGGAYACEIYLTTLTMNSASNGGGTAYCTNRTCIIVDNNAANGGGVCDGSNWNCEISGNAATDRGGGAYARSANSSMDECTISENSVGPNQVALDTFGGGANGYQGRMSGGSGGIRRCLITGNTATDDTRGGKGGGLFDCYAENCVITGNLATGTNLYQGSDGGVGRSMLVHCTVAYNHAKYIYGGMEQTSCTNSIVYHNTSDSSAEGSSNYSASCTFAFSCTAPNPGGSNISSNPQLVAGAKLGSASPCIDAVLTAPVVDYDRMGVARPLDGNNDGIANSDMGAYEYVNAFADTDGDGMLDNWEVANSLRPTFNDATEDPDSDDMSNLSEYIADTHPQSAASYLGITGLVCEASSVEIRWQGGENATQYLQRCDTLIDDPSGWVTIHTYNPPTGTSTNSSDPVTPGGTRFYRLRAGR